MPPRKVLARRLVRFALVGAVLTALSYALFVGGLGLGLHYLVASTLGWAAGIVASYFLNKRFTFARGGKFVRQEFLIFAGGYVGQLGLASLGYVVLMDGLGFTPTPAFAINLVFVALTSFLFMQFAVFRRAEPRRSSSGSRGSRS